MKTRRLQLALTLVDMMIAVAIVAILAAIALTTLTRIESKNKEHLCEATLETLNTALRQFRDYNFEYRVPSTATPDEIEFYRALKFPPDCNEYTIDQVRLELQGLLGLTILPPITPSPVSGELYEPNDSASAVMYFFLSQVPECRETLAGIDAELLKSDHKDNGNHWTIDVATNRSYPWIHVLDPWGTLLNYDYYSNQQIEEPGLTFAQRKQTIRSFPLITSAGPDKKFNTTDDITNREKTEPATYK